MSTTVATTKNRRGASVFQGLQKIGRSLQLPIAVLPAAGILNRLGQPDVFGDKGLHWHDVALVFAGAGTAIYGNLPLLFCVGVAIGFAKKADGSTALAALVGFLVYSNVLKQFPTAGGVVEHGQYVQPTYNDPGVLGGIIMGLLAAVFWRRFHRTKLVAWLGFFNGRRLVPIIMAFVGGAVGVLFLLVWPPVGHVITSFGEWITGLGAVGAGIYGLINRALIPIGMHQFVNAVAWLQIGDYKHNGTVVHGDLTRFFAGDPHAGQFMSGMFPIMMFGLPAAALAIAHCARPERRKAVTGMMMSMALTSIICGVTEPIEFTFMFIAPVLYIVHAILTALSMIITWALGVHLGFSFSAGLLDYLINWPLEKNPLLMLPIGVGFAVVYYVAFRFTITKLNILTPGREPEEEIEDLTK